MRLTHYIYIGAALFSLASCGDFNEKLDGYVEDDYRPTDVKTLTITLTNSDYESIASLAKDNDLKSNHYFANNDSATKHIPLWLKSAYPTADNGSTAKVTYDVVKVPEILPYSAKDKKNDKAQGAKEVSEVETESVTAPFELINRKWTYNPSVTLTLPNEKGNGTSKVFYQRITAWVNRTFDEPGGFDMFNPGGYLNRFGDTEYFSGCTYYNNRVEWIAADAKDNTPSVYGSMTDEEVVATMQQNLIRSFAESLHEGFEDAKPVEGLEVIYTINFTTYMEGKKLVPYTIKYEVTGPAEFTYIEGSLKPVSE